MMLTCDCFSKSTVDTVTGYNQKAGKLKNSNSKNCRSQGFVIMILFGQQSPFYFLS